MMVELMLHAMFHSLSVAVFGLSLLVVGAMLLSYKLNDQNWITKARNAIKFATAVYGVAGYYALLQFMAGAPLPVSLVLAGTAALPAIILGDALGLLLFRHARRRTLSHANLTLTELAKKVSSPRLIRWWLPVGVGLILIAVTLACSTDLELPTSTAIPTAVGTRESVTPVETAEPDPTATRTPTATATTTVTASTSPTPTPIVSDELPDVPDDAPAVFYEDFDGRYTPRIFPEINVEESVEPFYCDTPYTPEQCPALRRGSGNPGDLLMGRPEYKPTDLAERVLNGRAQQWFCFWRTCDAGVYVTVETPPGAVCEVEAYVQTWSARSDYGFDGADWVKWGSDSGTLDDQANSTWYIRVDASGGTNAFAPGLPGVSFSYSTGHYDRYIPLSYRFRAAGNETTVFIGNVRLWPIAHNDSYLDLLTVRCLDPDAPLPTPEPGGAPTPTPTPAPTPRPNDPAVQILEDGAQFTPYGNSHIREGHTVVARSVGGLLPNVPVDAYAVWSGSDGSLWICLDENWTWIENPDFYLYTLTCSKWTAWRYGGVTLGDLE